MVCFRYVIVKPLHKGDNKDDNDDDYDYNNNNNNNNPILKQGEATREARSRWPKQALIITA